MHGRIKLDPVAYTLLVAVLAIQTYTTFVRDPDATELIERSDRAYQQAVFEDPESRGVMHQVFRQNEIDRELLKAVLLRCGR